MDSDNHLPFKTPAHLEKWLRKNHDSADELWVKIYKKDSGVPSVTWDDCVVACIAWGWIDGLKRSLDDDAYLQRVTPRRAKSKWSKRNREHAQRLIKEGRMQEPGLAQVEAAKSDGRWDEAYAGSADLEIPDDFYKALKKNRAAKKFFETLNRANLYAIYYRLHSAKRPETKARRIASIVEMLAKGETFH